MSSSVVASLLLQIFAIALVLFRVRGRWLSHTGFYFVAMAFVVYGLTEIVQSIFPEYASYRSLIAANDLDNWMGVAGIAILTFALAYTTYYSAAKRRIGETSDDDHGLVEELPAWQVLAGVSALGVVGVTLRSQSQEFAGYWVVGLTDQLLLFIIVLASLAYLVKNGDKNLVWVLIAQAAVSVLLASRTAVLVTSILFVSSLARYRLRLRRRDVGLLIFVGLSLMAVVSASRYAVGREQLGGSLADRVSALVAGGQMVLTDSGTQSVLQDVVYRFDGNAFPALVGAQFERGLLPVGAQPIMNDFFLVVPQFLNPDKLQSAVIFRGEAIYIIAVLGLPVDVSFLPGALGVLYGAFGAAGLWVSALLFGLAFAWLDIWIHRKLTVFRTLLGMAITYSALTMDVGLIWYFINLRGIIVLYLVLRALKFVHHVFTTGGQYRAA